MVSRRQPQGFEQPANTQRGRDSLHAPGGSHAAAQRADAAPYLGISKGRSQLTLVLLFVLSLPLANPWIRGDGVGYYSFARALLIEHNLDFTNDYLHANPGFRDSRIDEAGQPRPDFITRTGHLDNHFTIGPAMLWTPFLLVAHAGVLLARVFGAIVAADGFSAPYRVAMALGTAFYAFLGLLISFRLARRYVDERWALLATLAVWGASSLPVYMYFNPSWSHAHSAFCVALFFWYWHRTRDDRTLAQWLLLGLVVGLMITVYFANAVLLAAPGVEALTRYAAKLRRRGEIGSGAARLFAKHAIFLAVVLVCMIPTFLTRKIIYGDFLITGYLPLKYWLWRTPAWWDVLFSSNHGLFAWTPVFALATVGLIIFCKRVPRIGYPFLAAALAFFAFISCYPDWNGLSSYGNRFFVSLTALAIVGLAVFLDAVAKLYGNPRAALRAACTVLFLLIAWNLGFVYQWGTHLVPARGPISWNMMVRNQFRAVPQQIASHVRDYFSRRKSLMREIEQRDIEQQQNRKQP